ncbi:MAG: UDP-N-acetylmuramate dehydrogenase [Candidatus Methylomirabilales bacterium]
MIASVHEGLAEKLRPRVRGRVEADAPVARLTSFNIGGPAALLVAPADLEDLQAVLAFAREEHLPVHVLGGGSNTLIRDGGIRGIVIRLTAFDRLERRDRAVCAGAGVRISRLLAFCMKCGLTGLEILSGVPGTVGGAVWGNAGAWGGAVDERVTEVELVTAEGAHQRVPRAAIPYRYRSSGLPPGSVVVAAAFGLAPGDPSAIRRQMSAYLVQRNAGQPVQFRSAGSIFKNPPGDFAGRLVEQAGLKGTRLGGAMISAKHGNFIVNLGSARAADVLALVALARQRVRESAGVELELEIRVIGEERAESLEPRA